LALERLARRFLGSGLLGLLLQDELSFGNVLVGRDKRLLAVGDARVGLLAQLFDELEQRRSRVRRLCAHRLRR